MCQWLMVPISAVQPLRVVNGRYRQQRKATPDTKAGPHISSQPETCRSLFDRTLRRSTTKSEAGSPLLIEALSV